MEKKMETAKKGCRGTAIRIHSFVPRTMGRCVIMSVVLLVLLAYSSLFLLFFLSLVLVLVLVLVVAVVVVVPAAIARQRLPVLVQDFSSLLALDMVASQKTPIYIPIYPSRAPINPL